MSDYIIYVWLALTVIFVGVELATAQLTTIWFAIGSAVALLLSAFGVDNVYVQIAVFVAVSAIALILTRPLVKRITKKKFQPTNADSNIGKIGIVETEINNLTGAGEVKVGGVLWTARSLGGEIIEKGANVKVCKIEGVKLIVERESN